MRRAVLTAVGVLAVYFAFPVGRLPTSWQAVMSVVGLLAGGLVLAMLTVQQVRRHIDTSGDQNLRLQTLVLLIQLAVLVFALGYYQIAETTDGQFDGIRTKIDALYFTVSTMATVGFGDVHATGQLARAVVTAQIAFNAVFVGALVSVLTTHLRERASERARSPDQKPGGGS